MDYRDNPQHRVGVNIKVVEFYSAFWTDFAPPLTMHSAGVPQNTAHAALEAGSDKAQERGPSYIRHLIRTIWGEP